MPLSNRTIHSLICLLIISAPPLFSGTRILVREGRPIVDGVYVNGHGPYRFLVDTGTNVNLIEAGLAKSIGLNQTFRVELSSAAGTTPVPGSDGNQVELCAVKAADQRFLFSNLEAIHRLSPDVQGVLGQWFLSGFDYLLDLRGKRLEFGKQNPLGSRAPFKMLNGRMVFGTNLGDLVLDSGAARLVRFGVDPNKNDDAYVRTVAGTQRVGMVSSKLMMEGRNVWQGDAVAMPTRTEPGVDGLLPLGVFQTVYVCNSDGYAVLQ